MLQPEVHDAVPPTALKVPVPSPGAQRRGGRRWRGERDADGDSPDGVPVTRPDGDSCTTRAASSARASAYGTADKSTLLLNVRSRHMSAFPDIPVRPRRSWPRRTGREPDAQAFLPRRDYAVYLGETLDRLRDERFSFRAERVLDVVPSEGGFESLPAVKVAVSTRAATVVLAHGNQRPAPLTVDGVPLPEARWHLHDPWDLDRLTALAPDAVVVLVGTGLTAVDVAITLLDDTPDRRCDGEPAPAAARRPHRAALHRVAEPGPDRAGHRRPLADLLRDQIAAARRQGVDWRLVVDGLLGADPGALAAARPRRAAPVPRVVRPRAGGTPPPHGHRGRSPPRGLPGTRRG